MATPAQIKFIHVLVGKIGIPDDHYRDILASYNMTSSANPEFAVDQANDLIDCLLKMAREKGIEIEPSREHTFKKSDIFIQLRALGVRRGMATYGQLCKIVLTWWNVSEMTTDIGKWAALNNFLKNKWQIERIEWLPIELVGKVLRTIETMLSSKIKKMEGKNG